HSEKKSWNLFLILALFLVAVFGLAALTYSWLTDSASAAPTDVNGSSVSGAYIDDFSYELQYSFDGDFEDDWNSSDWYDASSTGLGGVPVNYTDSNASDYIGNLKYRMIQHGSIKSTARIKFSYQWFKTETLTTAHAGDEPSTHRNAQQGFAFTLTPSWRSGWVDYRNDGYYYYRNTSYVLPQETAVPICNGFSVSSAAADFGGQLRIVALLDGVQFNRYREVWGLDS
ncbi:MAG: hypothetical protein IJU96_02460, partial [Clostridia bacterium]|nr:hypothetical protein [Clostridia bacterium]